MIVFSINETTELESGLGTSRAENWVLLEAWRKVQSGSDFGSDSGRC